MKYNEVITASIKALRDSGMSGRAIATTLGLSKSGVNDHLNRIEDGTETSNGPRIMFLDFENAPDISVNFNRFKNYVSPDHVLQEGGWIISAAWNFLGEDEVYASVVTPKEAAKCDDSRVVANVYEAWETADIVVAHYGDNFDVPLFKTRCLVNGFAPPKKVRTIDTVKMAKRLKFQSNKLEAIGNYLNIGNKVSHEGIKLWIGCMSGDQESLKNMVEYNIGDIDLLKTAYLEMRAFDDRLPNMGLYYKDNHQHCVACGSTDLNLTGNTVKTNVSEFAEVACGDCGKRQRVRKAITSKQHRSVQLAS